MEKIYNETPITDFTLRDLLSLVGVEQKGLMDKCIADDSDSQHQAFRFPCRIDAFIIGIGTEGETTVSYNLHECHLKKDTLFLFGPNNILQERTDNHFRAHVIAISSELMHLLNIDIKTMVPILMKFSDRPCFDISPEESDLLRKFTILVKSLVRDPNTKYAEEILSGLLSAILYKVGGILYNYVSIHPEMEQPVRDRTEAYFRQFMQLLGQHYRRERTVSFYARQLCITPKYLTTLIKRVSGKSVSEWIDNYVVLEAKTLLKHSHMSIQEIAFYLNFPNQSFFGSYFKRNTGMSPSQYKDQR